MAFHQGIQWPPWAVYLLHDGQGVSIQEVAKFPFKKSMKPCIHNRPHSYFSYQGKYDVSSVYIYICIYLGIGKVYNEFNGFVIQAIGQELLVECRGKIGDFDEFLRKSE